MPLERTGSITGGRPAEFHGPILEQPGENSLTGLDVR